MDLISDGFRAPGTRSHRVGGATAAGQGQRSRQGLQSRPEYGETGASASCSLILLLVSLIEVCCYNCLAFIMLKLSLLIMSVLFAVGVHW